MLKVSVVWLTSSAISSEVSAIVGLSQSLKEEIILKIYKISINVFDERNSYPATLCPSLQPSEKIEEYSLNLWGITETMCTFLLCIYVVMLLSSGFELTTICFLWLVSVHSTVLAIHAKLHEACLTVQKNTPEIIRVLYFWQRKKVVVKLHRKSSYILHSKLNCQILQFSYQLRDSTMWQQMCGFVSRQNIVHFYSMKFSEAPRQPTKYCPNLHQTHSYAGLDFSSKLQKYMNFIV